MKIDVRGRERIGCILLVIALSGLAGAGARADMLYYLPFQNAAGTATLANLGTVGGTASAAGGSYTNDTPPNVGEAHARAFPNTAARATLPDSQTRLTLTNAGDRITGMAWIKLLSTGTVQGIVNATTTGQTQGWTFQVRDTRKLTFVLGRGTTYPYIQRQGATSLPLNEWIHVAFSFTSGGGNAALTMYTNGVSIAHAGGDLGAYVAAKNPNVPIKAGTRDTDGWPLLGLMDEARLYDEILTEQQIRDIMKPPKGTVIAIK